MLPKHLSFLPVLIAASAAVAAPQAPRVLIEPVEVSFEAQWLQDMQRDRRALGPVREKDGKRIAADMAASLREALDRAVRDRGIEVVSTPAPGVLRLTARIEDLYVNAPDAAAPGLSKSFVREAGRATLRVQGRPTDGTASDFHWERQGVAGDTGRLTRATGVTNQFWFDAMFRRWADELAEALSARQQH